MRTEIAGNILSTKNHEMFKFIDGNRPINGRSLEMMKESIKNRDLLHLNPILVDSSMNVIDGQTRLMAATALNVPIYYIVTNEKDPLSIASYLNSNKKNWNTNDYCTAYALQGNKNYIVAAEIKKKYPFSWTTLLYVLSGRVFSNAEASGGGGFSGVFKRGEFIIKRSVIQSEKILSELMDFREYFEGFKDRNFCLAILRIRSVSGYSHKQMIEKAKQQRTELVQCASIEQYMKLLEKIYNFRMRNKLHLAPL